jgi:hypothetical protein
MSTQIGFVILSHNNPQQLLRLVCCLQRVYDDPPIAIHHDFGQTRLRQDDFPSDVQFVLPHAKTRWGNFSLVVAVLRALALLYQRAAPNWFVLLSGADYPTMRADKVLENLTSSGMDALLDYREVPNLSNGTLKVAYGIKMAPHSVDLGDLQPVLRYPPPDNPTLKHLVMPANLVLAWRRYFGFRLWFPVVRNGSRIGRYLLQLPFQDWRSPFAPNFKCHYGDQWFTGNHKVAEILLNPTVKHMQLRHYLRFRHVADECYYQTVLGNTAGLKISKATRRFADWTESAGGPVGGAHPKVLDLDDLSAIVSSKSYFARKFASDSPILDELDKMLA